MNLLIEFTLRNRCNLDIRPCADESSKAGDNQLTRHVHPPTTNWVGSHFMRLIGVRPGCR